MSWFSKRILKKGEKGGAEDWWNKEVKPIGKQNLWHGIGSTLGLIDPTNISSFFTCIGSGKNYKQCVERRAEKGISGLYMKAGDKSTGFDPDNPNAHFDIPDVPLHTGVDVTTGWDPESGITQAEYDAIIEEYTDNTTFGDEGVPGGGGGSTETEPPEEIKRGKPWLYAKGENKGSNLLSLINQMLQDPEPEKMQMGGPIGMGSMIPNRRMYSMPKKRKPVMQTSTAGMPMRGMNPNIPMMKQGGMTKKKYHI
tara:strand:- start:8846 stop:9604 length:759 start_codon:yes stop_codon:yes gene_type:complete